MLLFAPFWLFISVSIYALFDDTFNILCASIRDVYETFNYETETFKTKTASVAYSARDVVISWIDCLSDSITDVCSHWRWKEPYCWGSVFFSVLAIVRFRSVQYRFLCSSQKRGSFPVQVLWLRWFSFRSLFSASEF